MFSSQVDHSQLLFFGHPTEEEMSWKKSQWPPPEQHDHERHGGSWPLFIEPLEGLYDSTC